MYSKKLSIIIPAYKEGAWIRPHLKQVKKKISEFIPNYEIIIVVDGIINETFKEAKKVDGIKVHGYTKNMGKGFALKYGFSKSTGDIITFLDADGDIDAAQLRNLYPYLSSSDMVIGSKRHPFSKLHYPLLRKILSKCYQLFTKLVLGVNLRDTQSGIKLIKREVLEIIMPLVMVKRMAFDVELCFLAQKHGFRVVEAPIFIDYQMSGSSVGLGTIQRMFLDTLAIRYRYSILKYYQKAFHKSKFKK